MLISFSGTDGAGKSTQIELLQRGLTERGYKAKVIWARGGYTPLFSLLKRIIQRVGAAKIPKAGPSPERTELLSNPTVGKTWLTIAVLDLALFYGAYARWLSLLGYIVICDRYIEDTEIDFQINFPQLFDGSSRLWKLLTFVAPSVDCSFLLYVPVDLTLSRSEEKNEPFPDSADILDFRLLQYTSEHRFPGTKYIKIDGTQDIEVISKYINRRVEKLL